MRRTGSAASDAPVEFGDPERSAVLAAALASSGEVERATHGFHAYAAGLHPDAAARLLAAFHGDSVFDPFMGGGTVMVEARIAGRRAVGCDVSPISALVAAARTCTASEETLTVARAAARKLTDAARAANADPPEGILATVADWYAPHVLHELEALRSGIFAMEPGVPRTLLWACFSSTLVKVGWRKSDTSSARERHHRPEGTAAILFHKKVRELGRRIAELRDLVPAGTPEADLGLADARAVAVTPPVDLVLTSPPYPSTYDYLPMQHLRTVWLGLPGGSGEIGSRRAFREGGRQGKRAWIEDTRTWVANVVRSLRPGGHLVVVIGDGLTPSGPIDASQPTEEAARAAGLVAVARASVERADHARGAARWEHVFAFRRPTT
jgi:hypothetical protein